MYAEWMAWIEAVVEVVAATGLRRRRRALDSQVIQVSWGFCCLAASGKYLSHVSGIRSFAGWVRVPHEAAWCLISALYGAYVAYVE